MHVHIGHHFYGAGNFGDDIMLAGFLTALFDKDVKIHLTCCTPFDIESQRRRFPEIEWLPYTSEARQSAIKASHAWLGLGDTPFQSDSGPWFVQHLAEEAAWCRKYAVPMWFLGVGVNNQEVFDLYETQFLLSRVEGIWARDAASANSISQYFPKSRVAIGSDLANIYLRKQCVNTDKVAKSGVGICLHFEDPSKFDLPTLEAAILSLHDASVAWLIQEVREFDFSEKRLLKQFSKVLQQRLDLREPNYSTASIEELFRVWGDCDIVVSSRYHAALIQAWRGSRVAIIARNDKLRGLAEQIGCLPIENLTHADALGHAIAAATKADSMLLSSLADLAESSVSGWMIAAGV